MDAMEQLEHKLVYACLGGCAVLTCLGLRDLELRLLGRRTWVVLLCFEGVPCV